MTSTRAVRLTLGASRVASALICAACLASAVLVASLPGPSLVRGALVIAIGAYGIATLRLSASRVASHAIVAIELDLDRAVCLTERAGRRVVGVVQASSYVGAFLTTLVMRPEGKRRLRSVAIFPDMVRADDLRRLRLLLRLGHDP